MVFAFIYTILRPLKYIRRKELQGKIHDLTEQAVASLKCGAITTNIVCTNESVSRVCYIRCAQSTLFVGVGS